MEKSSDFLNVETHKCVKKSKKNKKKSKRKRKKLSCTSSEDSSSSDETSSSSKESIEAKLKAKTHKNKKLKKLKRLRRELKKQREDSDSEDIIGPAIPNNLVDLSKRMAPETKEEWEKRQNVIKRVYDEQTGRYRLIKGDGEILEEIVSKERHQEINKQATTGDGEYFQSTLLQPKLNRK